MSKLSHAGRSYLDRQLDTGSRGLETDLIAIAHSLLNWQEKLANAIGLSLTDIHDIKFGQYRDNHELQRYYLQSVIILINKVKILILMQA